MVLGVDQEDDSTDFGEVILPQTASCKGEFWLLSFWWGKRRITLLVTAEIESGESVVTNGEFL
jgi:hypothetical protein